MTPGAAAVEHLDELRKRKHMFDNTWMLAILLSASSVIVFWYLGLGLVQVGPIIWTLAALALVQFIINLGTPKCVSGGELRALARRSQIIGVLIMAGAWHLFGGLQQPMFPLFMMLPLYTGALILNVWQQQTTLILFIGVLATGVLLSPETNSFIAERYGISAFSAHLLPAWVPRSRVAFLDVSTSPTYNLMVTGSLAVLAVALTATSRAIVALSWRSVDSIETLRVEIEQARQHNTLMIEGSPSSELLIIPATGRIVLASRRFMESFAVDGPAAGQFFLDTVAFAYPIVIKRLIAVGGEEIQGATVRGREVVLRVRASLIDSGPSTVVRLCVETCDEICWRGAVDALEQPVFAVNSRGRVIFLNRSAIALFGNEVEGSDASGLFEKGLGSSRWWDIAPLESTRRMLPRGDRSYIATIRRERIAESIGELSFIHLAERSARGLAEA